MSIIYDALQKTQRNREYLRTQTEAFQERPSHYRLKWILFMVLALSIGASAGAMVAIYMKPSLLSGRLRLPTIHRAASKINGRPVAVNPIQAPPVKPLIKSSENAHWISSQGMMTKTLSSEFLSQSSVEENRNQSQKNRLALNGVLISGTDKIALINNQPYHLGDIIEGMKIIGIELNSVRLQDGQNVIELRT